MRSKEKVEVRKASVSDAKTLKDFWLNLAKEMFEIEGHIVPSVENADIWTSHLLDRIQGQQVEVLIAQEDDEPVGFIHLAYPSRLTYQTSEEFVVLNDLYIKPRYRRRSVGTRLMEEAMDRIRMKGFENVRLSVLSENVKAVHFYEKLGFEVYRYGMRKTEKSKR